PDTSFSVRAMSRSRLMPGKTRTADFISRASDKLDAVILNHGIGEKLVGRGLQRGLGLRPVGAFQLDVENLALAHARNAVDAKRFQRAFDRLALRVENTGFQRDGDAGFHGRPERFARKRGRFRPRVASFGGALNAPSRPNFSPSQEPGRSPAGARFRS